MFTTETLTTFLGWASVINIGVLLFTTLAILAIRKPITRIHAKLFGLDESTLANAYFRYLVHYKILVLVFNLAPYFALKVMGY